MHTPTRTHSRTQQQERQNAAFPSCWCTQRLRKKKNASFCPSKRKSCSTTKLCPCCPAIGFEPFFSFRNYCAIGSLFDSALGRKQKESQTFYFKGERTKTTMDHSWTCHLSAQPQGEFGMRKSEKNRKSSRKYSCTKYGLQRPLGHNGAPTLDPVIELVQRPHLVIHSPSPVPAQFVSVFPAVWCIFLCSFQHCSWNSYCRITWCADGL
ncbi:MAG: hypothetical protein BYD32DRAFT_260209 [Podila humilis]|nr:MAG: hypothetical protein BYD32DRAFT_260209 [Podila humilis]